MDNQDKEATNETTITTKINTPPPPKFQHQASTACSTNNNAKSPQAPVDMGRRLSLNITSTIPRRQSLTVEGLSSAFKDLATSGGNATGSLRNKAALKPGHSLMGWINLTSTGKDLNGFGGKIIDVTQEELAKHNTEDDCWISLKGNVYNVTVYLQYHPGGVDELMQAAGSDATDLFSEVHSWVNYSSILAKCYVGPLKNDSPFRLCKLPSKDESAEDSESSK